MNLDPLAPLPDDFFGLNDDAEESTDRVEIPAHSSAIVCVGDNFRANCLDCDWKSYVFVDKERAREWADAHQEAHTAAEASENA